MNYPTAFDDPATRPVGGDAVLLVQGAGKRYRRGRDKDRWAVRGLSLSVRRGSITALVGPNGAGKTTLLTAVAGLVGLTEGAIVVDGVAVTSTATPDGVGYLAQDKPLYRQYSVGTMLDIGRHLNSRWDADLARRLCDEAGLDLRAAVRTLSGGQRTRLALALVLARRPDLLLLDEPLADLDPLARLEVQQTLLAEATDTGMTVLMSSHILGEVQDTCSDLALITEGRLTLHGPIDEIVARHVLLVGPGDGEATTHWLPSDRIVEIRRSPRQISLLVDGPVRQLPDGWSADEPTLEEIVVARLRTARASAQAA